MITSTQRAYEMQKERDEVLEDAKQDFISDFVAKRLKNLTDDDVADAIANASESNEERLLPQLVAVALPGNSNALQAVLDDMIDDWIVKLANDEWEAR